MVLVTIYNDLLCFAALLVLLHIEAETIILYIVITYAKR